MSENPLCDRAVLFYFYASGGAKIVTPKSGSLAVRSVCGAPAGIISISPARISCSWPETRAIAQPPMIPAGATYKDILMSDDDLKKGSGTSKQGSNI